MFKWARSRGGGTLQSPQRSRHARSQQAHEASRRSLLMHGLLVARWRRTTRRQQGEGGGASPARWTTSLARLPKASICANETRLLSQWEFRSRFIVLETLPNSCRGDEINFFSLLFVSCKKAKSSIVAP